MGCTEKGIAFNVPIFQTAELRGLTPPEALPLINTPIGTVGTVAAAMVGAIAGGIGGAALMASRRLPTGKDVQAEAVTSDDDRTTPGGKIPGGD